jgi:hypothetical protein
MKLCSELENLYVTPVITKNGVLFLIRLAMFFKFVRQMTAIC